jgi:hypothetical protein
MRVNEMFSVMGNSCRRGSKVYVGQLVDEIDTEIFGVLMFIPALICILPFSIVPGVSSFCSVIILVSALHLFLGRKKLWLPEWVRNASISSCRMTKILEKLGNIDQKIDRLSFPRCGFFMNRIAQKLTACAGVILSSMAIVLGFIPLIDTLLMIPVALFGIGICTRDGAAVCMGWGVLGASSALLTAFL